MNVGGGRAARRLFVAGALALLLVPLIPAVPAQSAADPWWGPTERSNPTSGWAVRVPVVVENRFEHPLEDAFVSVDLDLSKLLVEAGWTNTSGVKSRGFTLDIDSIRVVRYGTNFVTGPIDGSATRATPHRFYTAMFDDKARAYDPSAPAGTVLFQIPGLLMPQEKRFYYVYANPTEYRDMPPATLTDADRLEQSPLDAFLWGTTGNVVLGYEPNQEGQTSHHQRIRAISSGLTTVKLYTYESGGFQLMPSTSSQANPITLFQSDAMVLLPAGKAFKIEADRPIVVWGVGGVVNPTDAIEERAGYVPGRSGSFADDKFDINGLAGPGGGMTIRVIKADGASGSVVVSVANAFGAPGPSVTLSEASPWAFLTVPGTGWSTVTSTGGKFLVNLQQLGHRAAFPKEQFTAQLPSTTGGPVGTEFWGFAINEKGFVRLCPEANATIRMVGANNLQLFPEGTVPNVPAGVFTKERFCQHIEVPRTMPDTTMGWTEMYATKEDTNPLPGSPVPFRAFTGAGLRNTDPEENFTRGLVGHYGGLGGVDYYTYGATGIFGHYNATQVTIHEERIKNGVTTVFSYPPRGLQRDDFFAIAPHAEGTGRFHITSSKPVAVVSLAATTFDQEDPATNEKNPVNAQYARHVPGRPQQPGVTVGRLEFRGPLVDLVSPAKAGQLDFLTTGPGTPVGYRLDVRNLGRWVQGAPLDDTVTVSCSVPVGWTVEGCSKDVSLSGASAERLNVVVTPSIEDVNQSRTILVEAASKSGGPVATFKLIVRVEVRYGVGMWFDVEGGRKTIDPPIGLSPGEVYRGTIVLKNTGSTQDRFALRLEEPADGWRHELLLDDEPVTSVLLEGGASALLTYRAVAPNVEQGPQNLVSITAQSESSALAADIVYPGTRIRPKIDLEMSLSPQTQIAAPNETAVFNLTTRNKGNDVFTVLFRQDSVLPVGWTATLTTQEVSLNPNDTYVMQLRVTPAEGARAGDLASLKLTAEVDAGAGRVTGDEVSAVVVVRRIYNLTSPPIFDAEAVPGDSLRFTLPVMNAGNGQVEVELLTGAVDATLLLPNGDVQPVADWVVELEADGIALALNESVDLPLRIDVPALTPPGLYNLTFTTRLSREALQNLTVPVQVAALSRVVLEGSDRVGLTPGRSYTLPYLARNTGNVEGVFRFEAEVPDGWNASFSPASANLAPGERMDVRLTLNASRDAANGPYDVALASVGEGQPPTSSELRVDVARPQLYLADVSPSGALRKGDLVLVTATVGNRGGITAENVSVALTVDEQVVDRVLLSRIPVGTTTVATLSWVATESGGDVAVVVDPEQEISLESRDGTAQEVSFSSRLGTPAPSLSVTLVALVALAFALALPGRRERK